MSLVRVYQPAGSGVCGQAAVAMLFNITLEKSFELFGHSRQTWTHDMIRVLRASGWKVPDKRIVISAKNQPTDPSIINIRFFHDPTRKNIRHWAVLWEGEMYCGLGWDRKIYEGAQKAGIVRFISYLPLTPPEGAWPHTYGT